MQPHAVQRLLSLPPAMAARFAALEHKSPPEWFATSDPPGRKLGSGGGSAHLLTQAWRATGNHLPFNEWLHAGRKLIIHGGGQSRRLPSYAAVGKILMPLPVFRWSRGQRLSQTLLDVQLPDYERVLRHAGPGVVALIASGDVLLRFSRQLPAFPEVDVLGLGMWLTPEKAKDFGVFFSPRHHPQQLSFFLQKPEPARIREEGAEHLHLVDTGMWLLSARAVEVLMRKCGWQSQPQQFPGDGPDGYEFYSDFALALGLQPTRVDADIASLTCAVLPLPEAEFYHFGTSRQMIESVSALQNLELDETKLGTAGARAHPDQFLTNTRFRFPLRREENHTLWVENSHVPESWRLASQHVLTGIPDNPWDLQLEPRVCLDFAPVEDAQWCVRAHGMDDTFAGLMHRAETLWFGRPAREWFARRALSLAAAGLEEDTDIQHAPLFPVLKEASLNPRFIEWLFAEVPTRNDAFAQQWLAAPRLAASDIPDRINLHRLYEQRTALRRTCLVPMMRNARWSVFHRLDLSDTAREFAAAGLSLPEPPSQASTGALELVHDAMFRAAVLRQRSEPGWEAQEGRAFGLLRDLILREAQLSPALPRIQLQEDQIVWARSPVRLDLGGGWTDTPPYCLEHGPGPRPVRARYRATRARGNVPMDKASVRFAQDRSPGGHGSLTRQLEEFGSGIEISLLAAVPKGSGLGTSSILAATTLAALAEVCGLGWDRSALFQRTLALEQMLTTGGGWQDQAGAIYGGIKLIETEPGLSQSPKVRWLPAVLFGPSHANTTILLYYTGITRLAKSILQEIVRGIFLNSPSHLGILGEIADVARRGFEAVQRCDRAGLVEAVRTSWMLNQALDPGTNPPEVQAILNPVQDWLVACKLLGAGGGGFLLMFAKDAESAARIRLELQTHPPNARARFVELGLSESGLELTRS